MSPKDLTNTELLDYLEEQVSCNTYCPFEGNHNLSISFSDLHEEILRRMELGERYESCSD
jgi:hypothetical protein